MNNVIRYYYDIVSDEFTEDNGNGIIKYNNERYVFKKVYLTEEQLKNILDILNSRRIKYNYIILNKNGSIYTKFQNSNFVLLKIIDDIKIMDFEILDIILFNEKDETADKWIKKADYYSKKINELNLENEVLNNLLVYYLGMAENAVSLYNRINKSKLRYTISHRRLNYPITNAVFYDPTNMMLDNISRDISEYIKINFIKDNIKINEIKSLINKYGLNESELNALFARLLYPSFFFDELDNIILSKNLNNINKFLRKVNKYEDMLKEVYKITNNQILVVDWIKK